MKIYENTYSTTRPPEIDITADKVFITSNIDSSLWVHGRHNKFGKDNPLPTKHLGMLGHLFFYD